MHENDEILIAGSGLIALDIIISGNQQHVDYETGGTCSNVLRGLNHLGYCILPIASIGNDTASQIIQNEFDKKNVDLSLFSHKDDIRATKIIQIHSIRNKTGKHTFLFKCPECKSRLPKFHSPQKGIVKRAKEIGHSPHFFFFDRSTRNILEIARLYKKRKSIIYFEPPKLGHNSAFNDAVGLCDILKISLKENISIDDAIKFCDIQLNKIERHPRLFIATIGSNGVIFRTQSFKNWSHIKALYLDYVIDTCGAGDWCTIGFIDYLIKAGLTKSHLLTNESNIKNVVEDGLRYSQRLSALSCMFIGAMGITRFANKDKITAIIKTENDLISFLKDQSTFCATSLIMAQNPI
jgi:sugar/nucleoside kinase (ribokinase family)